jgi:hypothetical protein
MVYNGLHGDIGPPVLNLIFYSNMFFYYLMFIALCVIMNVNCERINTILKCIYLLEAGDLRALNVLYLSVLCFVLSQQAHYQM